MIQNFIYFFGMVFSIYGCNTTGDFDHDGSPDIYNYDDYGDGIITDEELQNTLILSTQRMPPES